MAVAFVNNANNKVTGATSNTVAAYAGRAVDDIAILAMYAEGIAGALTWPTGFTEMAAIASANNDHKIWAAWRRVTGSEPTYTVSWTGGAVGPGGGRLERLYHQWRSAGCNGDHERAGIDHRHSDYGYLHRNQWGDGDCDRWLV